MTSERRRDERIETNVSLTCRVPARPRWSVMHDLSHVGCRLEFRENDLELGGTVVLEVPGARGFAGQIVWTQGKQVGVQFHRWLDGSAAVTLGLDEPEPLPILATDYTVEGSKLSTMLRHWMRRLTGRRT